MADTSDDMEISLVSRILGQKLAAKILGVLAAFLLFALAAIGLTLYSSWKLEGVAAAINDAGSLRMRSWKVAHDASVLRPGELNRDRRLDLLERDIADIEGVQLGLERGNPARPLFLPRDRDIPADMADLVRTWRGQMRPLVDQVINAPDEAVFREATLALDRATRDYVARIDTMVKKMEVTFTEHTNVLRSYQVALIALAVIGTVVLMRFFFVAVIRPVDELQSGMQRMQGEDFAARVPVITNDEFGDLSRGFNRMADHLQELYGTLEHRVVDKTRSLAEKNRELSILYEISRLLREPVGIEELSRGFLTHVSRTFEADAASVRLFDSDSDNLYITTQQGLAPDFVETEAVLACGDCLCGSAMLGDIPVISDTTGEDAARTLGTCQRAGFETVSAIPVNHNKRMLGIFNLYFRRATQISKDDLQVLQSLGQHLGMAIENVRLLSREKEMAVSEERNLIARELHDSIAQGLAFLNLQVQMLEDALSQRDEGTTEEVLDMIRRGIQESYADVRELLGHFRARLPEQDLAAALRQAINRFSEQSGVEGRFTAHGAAPPLAVEVATQVLYIAQEALSNVRKHAKASTVHVELWRDTEHLRLSIRDDGVGFDTTPRNPIGSGDHIGLNIMGERAARIGGALDVRSTKGKGTEVSLSVTWHEEEKAIA